MEKEEDEKLEKIAFSVDAGIVNRLGKELVGKAETAVTELIKNAYDADATEVIVKFIDTYALGGQVIILDNGHGMNYHDLVNGFMRIASADKISNPRSPKYKRQRAGRKGIGRFATQRLGEKLEIITKKRKNPPISLQVNWNDYQINKDIASIKNSITEIDDKKIDVGTIIRIEDLREKWSDAKIKRVFRYIADLLQPDYLSNASKEINMAKEDSKSGNTFTVRFYSVVDGEEKIIASEKSIIFDSALALIEGRVNKDGVGVCQVKSKRFNFDDELKIQGEFNKIPGVRFKAYYYIFGPQSFERYYRGWITKADYNKVENYADRNSGMKLYRNGFRVLPYGDIGDDWLSIDKTNVKGEENIHVPFNNRSFFGFVEIHDPEGEKFEETASREGLIENAAFRQLQNFLFKSLKTATIRVNFYRRREQVNKEEELIRVETKQNHRKNNLYSEKAIIDEIESLISKKENLLIEKKQNAEFENADYDDFEDDSQELSVLRTIKLKLEEAEMMRVLAAVGLTIAEFTHEVRQFIPVFQNGVSFLTKNVQDQEVNEVLTDLKDTFGRFQSYVSYIDETIINNVSRNKIPIKVEKVISGFVDVVKADAMQENIEVSASIYGYDLFTCPMHPSEWNSILYNLYTNAKKAIMRADQKRGKIELIAGTTDDKQKIYVEFTDNGDGVEDNIKDKIFDAFFTTATASYNAPRKKSVIGTGLGLKIIKDIIEAYNGTISLVEPEADFSTCFRIEMPRVSNETN